MKYNDTSNTPASFSATSAIKTENEIDNRQARRTRFRAPTSNLNRRERAAKREQHQLSR